MTTLALPLAKYKRGDRLRQASIGGQEPAGPPQKHAVSPTFACVNYPHLMPGKQVGNGENCRPLL